MTVERLIELLMEFDDMSMEVRALPDVGNEFFITDVALGSRENKKEAWLL